MDCKIYSCQRPKAEEERKKMKRERDKKEIIKFSSNKNKVQQNIKMLFLIIAEQAQP